MALNDAEFLGVLGRHFVVVVWNDAKKGEKEPSDGFVVSAFIMSVRGFWILVTAGHIVEEINTRLQAGREFKYAILQDVWADGATSKIGIPFPGIINLPSGHYHDEDKGIDYAWFILSTYYINLLKANNIITLSESDWKAPENLDGYNVIGILGDENHQAPEYDETGKYKGIRFRPTIYPYTKVDPPDGFQQKFPRLYFRPPLDTEGRPLTVKGMSGGPVFGFKTLDGETRMWLVGVQSAEYQGYTIACPVEEFGNAFSVAIEQEINRRGL